MKRSALSTIVVCVMVGMGHLAQAAGPNLVIFLGDGMGFEHVQARRLYRNGNDAIPLTFETLPYGGKAVTKLPNGAVTDSATTGSGAGNVTTYTDTGLVPSTTYTYVVRAFSGQGYADSNPVSAVTAASELEIPENLKAKAGRGVVNLAWTDTNTGESGYQVLRSESGGATTVPVTLPANSTKFADRTVIRGTTYQYQVRATEESTAGPVSSPVWVRAR